MTKKKFRDILLEYGYTEYQIDILWDSRPSNDLDEVRLRKTGLFHKDHKDRMIQK